MTVRARVTALATLAVVIVLVVSGAVLVRLQRDTLTSTLDESLIRMSHGLIADVAAAPSPTTLHPQGDGDIVAQVVASDGAVLAATKNLRGAPRINTWVAPARGVRVAGVAPVIGHKVPYRLLVRRLTLPDGAIAALYVGAPLDDVRDNIGYLKRSMTAAVPLMAAILAMLVWWLVGRTLRPVEQIRAEVAGMSGTDTHKRVPQPRGDDEIARLADTMNALLGRIEEATRRQRRFVADASHELRTPLTRMRAELEVDMTHPDSADAVATQASMLEELTALQQLVEDLLLLARSDGPVMPRNRESLDLAAIVAAEVRQSSSGSVIISTDAAQPIRVAGDAAQLRRVVRNLLSNAVHHARSTVSVSINSSSEGVTLSVTDDGPGVPLDARDRIFERFARVDDARASATGGVGLGLAIARDIVERHGGTICVVDNGTAGARFEVALPYAL